MPWGLSRPQAKQKFLRRSLTERWLPVFLLTVSLDLQHCTGARNRGALIYHRNNVAKGVTRSNRNFLRRSGEREIKSVDWLAVIAAVCRDFSADCAAGSEGVAGSEHLQKQVHSLPWDGWSRKDPAGQTTASRRPSI